MSETHEPDLGGMQGLFLVLLFLAEMAAWAAIGVTAYRLAGDGWRGALVAGGVVILILVSWGLLASPKSKAPTPIKLIVQFIVFSAAVAGLLVIDYVSLAGLLTGLILTAAIGARATRRAAPDSPTDN
ncbi:YrdB family protein [Granulicoccus sp. GXG6511]|uniref:YrdB family protein n=1 Tax=Granulicoccus sp. GXG6511 TaxID=3381351 RepID=UPI003D7DAF14